MACSGARSSSTIRNNVISINAQGVTLSLGGSGNTFDGNKIGMSLDGNTTLPNVGAGVALSDGANDNLFKHNIISGNGNWGVDITYSPGLAQVSNTIFRGNTIGLDASGNDAGNFKGGVRVNNAPGTRIGEPGQPRNVISGNGGPQPFDIGVGIEIVGSATPPPSIRNNYIGTDPSGILGAAQPEQGDCARGPGGGRRLAIRRRQPDLGAYRSGGGAGIIVGLGGGGSVIQGNTIGLGANGAPISNGYSGITVRSTSGVTIGGTTAGARNVISGNGFVRHQHSQDHRYRSPAVWHGNRRQQHRRRCPRHHDGRQRAGRHQRERQQPPHRLRQPQPHRRQRCAGRHPHIQSGSCVLVQNNNIRNNTGIGIDLEGDGVTANDAGDTDSGANGLQNFPVLYRRYEFASAPTTQGHGQREQLLPAGNYTLEFYASAACGASGHGEGERQVGSFFRASRAAARTAFTLSRSGAAGQFITATATDADGNTSEFSACAASIRRPIVTNTNDSGPGSLRDAIATANATAGDADHLVQHPRRDPGDTRGDQHHLSTAAGQSPRR